MASRVVVTGASFGIGASPARPLAGQGATVGLVARPDLKSMVTGRDADIDASTAGSAHMAKVR